MRRHADEVITHNVIVAKEDTPVHELANRMIELQVNRLPIVRHGQPMGIVTPADILKVFLRQDDVLAREALGVADTFILDGKELRVWPTAA